jgi:hypothetical protein
MSVQKGAVTMRSVSARVRNIAFGLLLLAVSTAGVPGNVSAAPWCDYVAYFQNWSGACSGGESACGYYRQQCEYLCFVYFAGNLCSANLQWCQESNHGSEEWPNYCLDNGWCECIINW